MTSCALEGVVSTFRLSQLKIIPILFAEAVVDGGYLWSVNFNLNLI
ncbi:hypothetical protein ACVW01_001236 [Thermostichus sp. MS-CIW-19]|jgi:hypothetical protein|nr:MULTISPECIES: hypothetical protein [unclassified Synechococcus]ABC99082.1 hypothetical protein CYA_0878 [Synechococcus sp. JA-3-3Ab]PIK87378.1 hypothetical protein SYN63AY4M2_03240 [Synechococcus sp. 63AY4M2]PIK89755.1 hypothetical protein SYN65AY6A5_07035 [Synechococcus sp. 65AY6A5]PIK93072.1 hypothetical protein SYN65AY6LI_00385 [Synechococcus sp. 65AY6Li]